MATSFQSGKKWVDGRAYEPLVAKTNASRSNPNKPPYRTIFWADGLASCNCTGWATHKHCRHERDLLTTVEAGHFGPAVRDLRRLAKHDAPTPMQRRVERRLDSPASYVVAPEVAPENPPTSLDGDKIEYRRIRL